jgi:hypothetical protein
MMSRLQGKPQVLDRPEIRSSIAYMYGVFTQSIIWKLVEISEDNICLRPVYYHVQGNKENGFSKRTSHKSRNNPSDS